MEYTGEGFPIKSPLFTVSFEGTTTANYKLKMESSWFDESPLGTFSVKPKNICSCTCRSIINGSLIWPICTAFDTFIYVLQKSCLIKLTIK